MDLAESVGKLEAMGSPDQIALEMELLGIKSKRGCPWSCVVADYLMSTVSGVTKVAVGSTDVDAWTTSGKTRDYPLPESVTVFINNFDAGRYPQLEAGSK